MSNPTSTLTHVLRAADALGVKLPKPLATERANLADLEAKVRGLDLRANLAGAILAALDADRDPWTDPEVQRETIRHQARGMEPLLREALAARTRSFLDTYAADLHAAFADPFKVAAATIAEAHDQIGNVALDNAGEIIAKGGNAAGLWVKAKEADQAIATIQQTWGLLAVGTHAVQHDARYKLLVIADVDAATWHDDRLTRSNLSAWDAVCAGYPLSYAETTEVWSERVAAIHREASARQERANEEPAHAWRRTHGMGRPVPA